jgi:hypothetical protein
MGDGMPCFDRLRYRRQDGHVFLWFFVILDLHCAIYCALVAARKRCRSVRPVAQFLLAPIGNPSSPNSRSKRTLARREAGEDLGRHRPILRRQPPTISRL